MKTPKDFLSETERLNKIANNPDAPLPDRVISLCHLYRWYQGDVHEQAKIVRRIEDAAYR